MGLTNYLKKHIRDNRTREIVELLIFVMVLVIFLVLNLLFPLPPTDGNIEHLPAGRL